MSFKADFTANLNEQEYIQGHTMQYIKELMKSANFEKFWNDRDNFYEKLNRTIIDYTRNVYNTDVQKNISDYYKLINLEFEEIDEFKVQVENQFGVLESELIAETLTLNNKINIRTQQLKMEGTKSEDIIAYFREDFNIEPYNDSLIFYPYFKKIGKFAGNSLNRLMSNLKSKAVKLV